MRQDHYTRKAKQSGYPARSVFKLSEIQKRHRILKRGMRVLDIGASPGSWSMYAAEVIGATGSIVAIDLKPDHPKINDAKYQFLHGDFQDLEVESEIAEAGPYDCVLSDAAPSTTGMRTVDANRSASLVESVVLLADKVLKPGGNLVVKLFQGGDERRLLSEVRSRFTSAHQFKPQASRKESFEVFIVGIKKRVVD